MEIALVAGFNELAQASPSAEREDLLRRRPPKSHRHKA